MLLYICTLYIKVLVIVYVLLIKTNFYLSVGIILMLCPHCATELGKASGLHLSLKIGYLYLGSG